jgi:hypothetical protein
MHHQLRSYRLPGETTTVPDSAESLYRLAIVLGGLFNFPTGLRLREPSPPPRARMRSPRSQHPTVGQALREGPIDTWAASVNELATEPR